MKPVAAFAACIAPAILAPTLTAHPGHEHHHHTVVKAEAQRILDATVEETGVPALAAALADDHAILFQGASGVRVARSSSTVGADEPFHIGSCTKAMTATIIGMLVESGELRWDTTLAEALPDLAEEMDAAYRPVTIAALLRHRAGVPSFTSGMAPENAMLQDLTGTPMAQRAELTKRILTRPPAQEPGEFVYSNGGYGVASAIAERITGESWEDLLRERLFEPLKMETAGFGWPATKDRPDFPRGHYADPQFGDRPQILGDAYQLPTAIAAAGDVYCSAADLARFAQMHLLGLTGHDGLLKAETIRELHRAEGDYAAGWGRVMHEGSEISSHDGSAGTFYTRMTVVPADGLAVVAHANTGRGMEACAKVCAALAEHATAE